jgi:hypothetical protein
VKEILLFTAYPLKKFFQGRLEEIRLSIFSLGKQHSLTSFLGLHPRTEREKQQQSSSKIKETSVRGVSKD